MAKHVPGFIRLVSNTYPLSVPRDESEGASPEWAAPDSVSYSLARSARWVPDTLTLTEREVLALASEPFGGTFSLRAHPGLFRVCINKSFAEFKPVHPFGLGEYRLVVWLVVQQKRAAGGTWGDFCRCTVGELLGEHREVEQC